MNQGAAWIPMWCATLCAAIGLAAPARAVKPLAGRFSSPLGAVLITEVDGEVKGALADAKNPCGMKKGAVILEGTRLDDSVVGTLRACKVGEGCSGALDGAAMLLITKQGSSLSGAVHFEAGACKTPLQRDAIVFRKSAAAGVAPVQSAPLSKSSARQRAETLAREAETLLHQNDGNAELARQKFQDAIRIDPEYAEGFVGVGVTYFARDRYDEALEWYKKALEVNPGLGDAYYNTACVYALRNDKAQALRYLRIALLNGYVQLATLSVDPDLSSLQGDPAFEAMKRDGAADTSAFAPVPTAPVDAGPADASAAAGIDRAPGN